MKTENKTSMAVLPDIKEFYEAPIIHLAEIRVEQGFQLSGLAVPGETDSEEYTW